MNIQKVYSAQIYNMPIKKNNGINTHFGISMPKSIDRDTVTFQAKAPAITKEMKAALARKEARARNYARLLDEAKTQILFFIISPCFSF